jgi:hypothetical protein
MVCLIDLLMDGINMYVCIVREAGLSLCKSLEKDGGCEWDSTKWPFVSIHSIVFETLCPKV